MDGTIVNTKENKDRQKLYLLIDSDLHTYFFENELRHMMEKYDVTVLSANEITGNISIDCLDIKRVDNNFRSLSERIRTIFHMVTDVTLYKEIFNILSGSGDKLNQIKDSLNFYKQSEKYYAGLKRDSLIKENGEGIIYCYWYNFTPLAIINRKEYSKYNIITRTHGYELYDIRNEFGRQPFKMLMDEKLKKVVFACEYAKEYYLNRYGIKDSDKYPVCALGTLDNNVIKRDYSSIKRPKDNYLIVSCSDLVPLKRVDLIVKGLSKIDDINIKWVHFGSGREEGKIKGLISELIENKDNITVELKGRVKNDVLHQFYNENSVDLFITTTYTEGGNPVSIMEAMSHGIPIVATNVCNIPRMINKNGYLISENPSATELASAIKEILTLDEGEYVRLCEHSRILWEENYNSDLNSEKFIEDVLYKLCQK